MALQYQVSYYYDPEIGNFYYGHGHPMKPHRVRMAHDLIVRYGLHRHMEVSTAGSGAHCKSVISLSPDWYSMLRPVPYAQCADVKASVDERGDNAGLPQQRVH